MSALPRPDVTGPVRVLNDALHDLHHRAGWPSLRALARETGVSHTTVSKAFSRPDLPTWGTLELLVEAMDGSVADFHQLWVAASAPTNGDRPPTARIAGRRAELDAVRRHLESGRGLLLISGEAGIGKSTLIESARDSADGLVVTGHCLPLSTQVPLLPFTELLAAARDADGVDVLTRALAAAPGFVRPTLGRLLPFLVDGDPISEPDDRWSNQRLFAAVGALLDSMSRIAPTAVIIDDLHWADDATLDLVEHLANVSGTAVVGTWRTNDPDVPETRLDWSARIRRNARTIELAPLSLDECTAQLRSLQPGVTDAEAHRIHARSGGVPLFTEHLLEAGDTSAFLDDVLDRRIGPLDHGPWEVAALLGVADRPLPDLTLQRATSSAGDPAALTTSLRELQHRHLAEVDGTTIRLRHPLLAEAVRRRLLPHEARHAHGLLAAAMAEDPHAEPAEVAAHWQSASRPQDELTWRIRAARAASARFSGAQSAEHWLRVLELWPPGEAFVGDPPLRRHAAIAAAADQLDLAGRSVEAASFLDEALGEPDAFETLEYADLLRLSARINSTHFAPGGRGLELIDQSINLFRTVPPSPGLAAALNWKAVEMEWHGRRTEATSTLEEAARMAAAAGDAVLERSVRAQHAWHLAASGDERAIDLIDAIKREPRPSTRPDKEVSVAVRHTDILLMACRPAGEVEAAAVRELEAAEEWDSLGGRVAILRSNVCTAWRREGRLERAMSVASATTEEEDPGGPPFLHTERALLELLLGHTESAVRRLGYCDVHGHEAMDPYVADAWMQHEVWSGEPAAAFTRFETMLRWRHDEISPGIVGDLLALAARAAADMAARRPRGDVARRLQALRPLLHHDPYVATAVRSDRAAGPQWAAEVARLERSDTIDTWLTAVRNWDRLTRPHDAAYCRWRAAQVALREGQGTVATRLLKKAAADAREHVPLSEAIAATARTGR